MLQITLHVMFITYPLEIISYFCVIFYKLQCIDNLPENTICTFYVIFKQLQSIFKYFQTKKILKHKK